MIFFGEGCQWCERWFNGDLFTATCSYSFVCGCIYLCLLLTQVRFSLRFPPWYLNLFNPFGGHPFSMYTCPVCFQECRTSGGLTKHRNSAHRQFTPESDNDGNHPVSKYQYHPHLTGMYILSLTMMICYLLEHKPNPVTSTENISHHIHLPNLLPNLLAVIPQMRGAPLIHASNLTSHTTTSLRHRIQQG
jgi:hypothetical protein